MIKLHSPENFTKEIENLVETGGLSYLEAISHYVKKTGLEIESVVKLITGPLKEKLRLDAYEKNLLGKKTPKLIFDDEQDETWEES